MAKICVSSIGLNSTSAKKPFEFSVKKTSYGELQYDNCSRNFFARDAKNGISILFKTLAEESNISDFSKSPINILSKSVNLILNSNILEIEVIGTSLLRSISQLGTACLNHHKGILIFNSPWSGEFLRLRLPVNSVKSQEILLNNINSEEIKITELVNLAIQGNSNKNNSNELIMAPGQCLLLDFQSNLFTRINFCSEYFCKFSTHLKDKNISLLADSGGQLKLNHYLLDSRKLAGHRCGRLFGDIQQNLLFIENQLSTSLNDRSAIQIFAEISSFSIDKIRNHSKLIFNGLDLPLFNMCVTASTLQDDALMRMINCNKFSSEIFYRRFISNWIIQLSPFLLE